MSSVRLRSVVLLACGALGSGAFGLVPWACASTPPPILGDYDGSRADVFFRGDAVFAPEPDALADAAPDGAVALVTDYEALCPPAASALWSYHDFQTRTPKDSALVFLAQTAATKGALDSATPVQLARVTGPDITSWTGVDVDSKLKAAGQQSLRFLRVVTVLEPASDATAPTLVVSRQQYDCILNM